MGVEHGSYFDWGIRNIPQSSCFICHNPVLLVLWCFAAGRFYPRFQMTGFHTCDSQGPIDDDDDTCLIFYCRSRLPGTMSTHWDTWLARGHATAASESSLAAATTRGGSAVTCPSVRKCLRGDAGLAKAFQAGYNGLHQRLLGVL